MSAIYKRGKTKFNHAEHGECFYYITDPDGFIVVLIKETNRYVTVHSDDLTEVLKQRSGLQAKPKVLTNENKTEKQILNEFFKRIALKIPFNCQNCEKPLYANNEFAKRSVCAHLLPKAIFKSVATDENNIVFLGPDLLGVCNCHDRYDANVKIRIGMPIYQLALERFEILKEKLTGKELIQAYTYLGLEWGK